MFSLESLHRGDSNEYTQYTVSQNKKEYHPKLSKFCSYGNFSKGLRNEFETAVVNEPSEFEPLKFYCISMFVLALSKLTAGYIQLIMNILPDANTI